MVAIAGSSLLIKDDRVGTTRVGRLGLRVSDATLSERSSTNLGGGSLILLPMSADLMSGKFLFVAISKPQEMHNHPVERKYKSHYFRVTTSTSCE
eukprot:gene21774-27841_t